MSELDHDAAALVLVDVTNGFLGIDMAPHSGSVVLANAVALADAFRSEGCLVVLTSNAPNAALSRRYEGSAPPRPVFERDLSLLLAKVAQVPNGGDIAADLGPKPGDLHIRKFAWSAFFQTDLDLQLRRRGVRTVVIGGITTNFGVEGTGRDARALGYSVIFVEDAMRAITVTEHEYSCEYALPMIGRVMSTDAVRNAL